MNYFSLPKIDLHCHLDGGLRPSTLMALAHEQDIRLPTDNIDELSTLMIAPESCTDLVEYLKRFELPLSVMQTESGIERVAFELFEDAARENVKYQEVRFGPLLHTEQGLSLEQIMESVIRGLRKAEALYDIKGNYILSILRHMPKDRIIELLDVAAKHLNNGVVAFDLAGAEISGFCHEFIPYAQYALKKGYQMTIHAGEQGDGQNVYDAINLLGAERIGHGIHITGHPDAYDLVKAKQIALETCPSSNLQTKAVTSLAEHPIKDFYQDAIPVTINTDNRTVSNTTMTNEVKKVITTFNLSREDYFNIYKTSVEHSFASDAVKQHLLTFAE